MNPDDILADMRDLAGNATRAARNPNGCADHQCTYRHRAEAMAARFTALDTDLSGGGLIPMAWAGAPDFPDQRLSDDDL
ncbi:hypothetical protein [Catenulispora pinisilvae]|uniref:hypothetical protein n=1 Tax=Catenulispora pinisilvae TaxID=2705253 RepID=UPI00189127F7|nr:hypothetical protein [Catenulispora pinisilvae]